MSQLHNAPAKTQKNPASDAVSDVARPMRAPLINRLIDPSNVVFSPVFCEQTRRDFEVKQAA